LNFNENYYKFLFTDNGISYFENLINFFTKKKKQNVLLPIFNIRLCFFGKNFNFYKFLMQFQQLKSKTITFFFFWWLFLSQLFLNYNQKTIFIFKFFLKPKKSYWVFSLLNKHFFIIIPTSSKLNLPILAKLSNVW
jgi:hypothetical protein